MILVRQLRTPFLTSPLRDYVEEIPEPPDHVDVPHVLENGPGASSWPSILPEVERVLYAEIDVGNGRSLLGRSTGVPLQIGIDPEPRVAIRAVERSGAQEKVATPPSSRPYRTPRLSVSRHEA